MQKDRSPIKSKNNGIKFSKRFETLADEEYFEFVRTLLIKMMKQEKNYKRKFSNDEYKHLFKILQNHVAEDIDLTLRVEMLIKSVQFFLDEQALAISKKYWESGDKRVKSSGFLNESYIHSYHGITDFKIEAGIMNEKNETDESTN